MDLQNVLQKLANPFEEIVPVGFSNRNFRPGDQNAISFDTFNFCQCDDKRSMDSNEPVGWQFLHEVCERKLSGDFVLTGMHQHVVFFALNEKNVL